MEEMAGQPVTQPISTHEQEPVTPASPPGWREVWRGLAQHGLHLPMLGMLSCSLLMLVIVTQPGVYAKALLWLPILGLLVSLAWLAWLLWKNLLAPCQAVEAWAQAMEQGRTDTRVTEGLRSAFNGELSRNINRISDRLQSLTQDLDAQVRKQTDRIEQKTRSLEILYDVAASINISRDLNDLLIRFLHTLKDLMKARAAAVRLLTDDGKMRMIYSIGLNEEIVEQERLIPVQRCMCGEAATSGELMCQQDIKSCGEFAGQDFFSDTSVEMLAVPLQYRGRTLGVYNLFVERNHLDANEDFKALLTSIGRHLGMAIEKAQMDSEAKRLTIIQERNMLAHELHDSLAQTLASLRFQVRVLDETLQQSGGFEEIQEIEQIENSLDEAYIELRELIAHFRAPIDQRGLIPSLEKIVQRFRKETGIAIFLQKEWQHARLPVNMELQVLRIIQECLANIRKHSQAHAVRIMMRCDQEGHYWVLVEDDGVGFGKPVMNGHPGEHVGLSIMRERAAHLNGRIRIESEPGEGTRIQLTFQYDESKQFELPNMQAFL